MRISDWSSDVCSSDLAISATSLVESDLPVTQEQLADLLGLTPVHINRTLKELERAGAVARSGRRIRIGNLDRLRDLADFSDLYLHSQDAFIHDRAIGRAHVRTPVTNAHPVCRLLLEKNKQNNTQ